MKKAVIWFPLFLTLIMCFGFVRTRNEKNAAPAFAFTEKIKDTLFGVDTLVDFRLKNVDGRMISLSDYTEAKGFIIVFTCNHCPFAKLYTERLKDLSRTFTPKGVPLIAISSTDTVQYEDDTFVKMGEKAKKEEFNFPYLYDNLQSVAKNFNAQKTPHAFVIWKEQAGWKIKYSGAIDDNGASPQKVNRAYVREAVDALLKNEKIETQITKSIGCQIYWRSVGK